MNSYINQYTRLVIQMLQHLLSNLVQVEYVTVKKPSSQYAVGYMNQDLVSCSRPKVDRHCLGLGS